MSEAIQQDTSIEKVAEAYIDPEERVLDPEKLDASILERMPQPTGWRMLVLPYSGKTKTKGGILLANETVPRYS